MNTPAILSGRKPVLGINSLGRIGKLTLWHHAGRKYFKEIVVNQGRDIGMGMDHVVQTIEKDSTYGLFHTFLYGINAERRITVADEKEGRLLMDGIPVTVLRTARNPKDIPWRDYGVEVVADCTGAFLDPTAEPDAAKGSLRGHMAGGARAVIASAAFKIKNRALPMPEDAVTLIYGINHRAFDPARHVLVSAASCTTTALAHMVKPLLGHEKTRAILTASASTVHAATNSQSVLDNVPKAGAKDLRKTRSSLDNIILTSTNAAEALALAVPEVKAIGFMADSIRIPVKTESLLILNATFQDPGDGDAPALDARTINGIYRQASEGDPERLLAYSEEQNVSADVAGIDASVVIEGQFSHTRTAFISFDPSRIAGLSAEARAAFPVRRLEVPVVHAKIFGWYDNEYGSYTNRMGDLAVHIHQSLR
ncbi:MAG TPA: glyceraldehyde 3-phosphate dehydrogenase NAD-binding domain-containing protein [Candidatus Aminicenantes bacterium]|nr:glyceraldehyde 3-phosphate dehydrogenase NAD-binding domain-containing protein [Candidatus Aminicenantes bacterium]